MNNAVIKVLTAGKRLGTDGPRELIPTLIERPILDEDEFSIKSYARKLEEVLNDKDTSDEEYDWIMNCIAFLGGTVEWVEDWNGKETAFVSFSSSEVAA